MFNIGENKSSEEEQTDTKLKRQEWKKRQRKCIVQCTIFGLEMHLRFPFFLHRLFKIDSLSNIFATSLTLKQLLTSAGTVSLEKKDNEAHIITMLLEIQRDSVF